MSRFDPSTAVVRPDYPRTRLEGRLVAVMRLAVPERGLALIPQVSRCIRRYDVHEIVLTDEPARPGGTVQNTAYLGFVEFAGGGVVLWGDEVRLGGTPIGSVCGFDETHAPNHLNIVVQVRDCRPGIDLGCTLGESVILQPIFTPPAHVRPAK